MKTLFRSCSYYTKVICLWSIIIFLVKTCMWVIHLQYKMLPSMRKTKVSQNKWTESLYRLNYLIHKCKSQRKALIERDIIRKCFFRIANVKLLLHLSLVFTEVQRICKPNERVLIIYWFFQVLNTFEPY